MSLLLELPLSKALLGEQRATELDAAVALAFTCWAGSLELELVIGFWLNRPPD